MIELQGVKVQYEDASISFKDFCFKKGKSYAILGPSGCGKTTLLNLISGELKSSEGKLILEGKEVCLRNEKEVRGYKKAYISYVTQNFNLFEAFTVKENLKLMEEVYGQKLEYQALLQEVGLLHKENVKVKKLSGGEKQRIAIVRALLQPSPVLLGDEPTASLNSLMAQEMMGLLLKRQKGKTLIVVTHDERLVSEFDEVIQLEEIAHWEVKL